MPAAWMQGIQRSSAKPGLFTRRNTRINPPPAAAWTGFRIKDGVSGMVGSSRGSAPKQGGSEGLPVTSRERLTVGGRWAGARRNTRRGARMGSQCWMPAGGPAGARVPAPSLTRVYLSQPWVPAGQTRCKASPPPTHRGHLPGFEKGGWWELRGAGTPATSRRPLLAGGSHGPRPQHPGVCPPSKLLKCGLQGLRRCPSTAPRA